MPFDLNENQHVVKQAIEKICRNFNDDYWLSCDKHAEFPQAFVDEIIAGGWLGIAMPEAYGGAGLGIGEAAILAHTISRSGAGMTGASAIHINLFGPHPIVVFGNAEQKQRFLPPLIAGTDRCCFGVTEANAGLNTTSIETRAQRQGNAYVIHGQKMWTSTAQRANKILLVVRTTPKEQCLKPTDGLTLFYTDLDRSKVEVKVIDKMGRAAVDTNALFIDGLTVPLEDRIGEEGDGWKCLLHGLNPERILIAAEACGLGQVALEKAALYARERKVFDRSIGKNQAIQHPLAENWMELEAAFTMMLKAASEYDSGRNAGVSANTAKYLAAHAALKACQRAVLTHGGMGYAKEFHVERYLREIQIPVIAPVSQEMIKNFIAEKVLGQEKSY